MKLCFIAAGGSIHSYRWIKYFVERGHQVHWISLSSAMRTEFSEILNYENLKFYSTPILSNKIWQFFKNIFFVRKTVKKIQPDILHAHCAGVDGFAGAMTNFHPFLLTPWGSDILISTKSKILKSLIKFALNKADLITCDAEHMKKAITELGINPSKIKIIYFGVDTEKFIPGLKDESLIQKLKIQNCPVIISLRNFKPIYSVETLIKAIPLVLKEIPEAKFIIAGNGSEEEKLKNLVRDLKIGENVNFIGFISNDDLPRYLRTVDIYVSTSLSDSTSVSLLEAMSCGLTSVVTEVGENKLILKNGRYGFLVPPKNSKILAEKIIYLLLKNEKVKNKMGKIGRKIIEEKYNYYKEMDKIENIYKSLIKTKL